MLHLNLQTRAPLWSLFLSTSPFSTGHTRSAEILLEGGADVDAACDGNPPLCMAACVALLPGGDVRASELVMLLLSRGAEACDR